MTKWETGKGLPDVENIKAISSLLNVSIDDEFMTSSALSSKYEGKSFQRGKYIYKKLYDIKAYHGKSR